MGVFWALLVSVLTVWFTKGSGLPVGGKNEMSGNGQQRTMGDLSPNDSSMKKALTLQHSLESVLLRKSKEVQLETNQVEVATSAVYLQVVEKVQGDKGSSSTGQNGTVDDGSTGQNGTVDDGSAGQNGTVDDGSAGQNGTVDDGSAGQNGTVDDGSAGQNGTVDDGSAGQNGTVDDGSTGQNGTVDDYSAGSNNGTLGDCGYPNCTVSDYDYKQQRHSGRLLWRQQRHSGRQQLPRRQQQWHWGRRAE
uniref:Uncharacterized protein n=1 Tax=Gasterosteus aculeatus TaxID=69293 RepID=G3NMZ8_GASAC